MSFECLYLATMTRDIMWRQAMREKPREMCGILVGHERCARTGMLYFPGVNESVAEDEYIVDVVTHMKALDAGELVGVVHSHVYRNCHMSGVDLANAVPGLVYLILSVADQSLGAWRVDEDREPIMVPIIFV